MSLIIAADGVLLSSAETSMISLRFARAFRRFPEHRQALRMASRHAEHEVERGYGVVEPALRQPRDLPVDAGKRVRSYPCPLRASAAPMKTSVGIFPTLRAMP